MSLKAEDIMSRDVMCVREDTTTSRLVEILHANRISGVPVLDSRNVVIGVVSLSDVLFGSEAFGDNPLLHSEFHRTHHEGADDVVWDELIQVELEDREVRDIMSTIPITAKPETPLTEIAKMMLANKVHRIIIESNSQIAGIVSTMDFLKAVQEETIS
jgi:CBS-domain-containing membrane protein